MTDTNVSLLALMSSNAVSPGDSLKTKGAKESGIPDFGNLLSQTGLKQEAWKTSQVTVSSAKTSDTGERKETVSAGTGNAESTKVTVKTAARSDSAKEKIAQKLSGADQQTDAEVMDVDAALEQISQQIVQIVSQGLGVDSEQLMDALKELGLTVGDLLDSTNLADLFGFFTEEVQPLELLTNPDFQDVLTELGTLTEELANLMDTSVSEVTDLLKEALDEQQLQQKTLEMVSPQTDEALVSLNPETAEVVTKQTEQVAAQQSGDLKTSEKAAHPMETDGLEATDADPENEVVLVQAVSEEDSGEEQDLNAEEFFSRQSKEAFREEATGQNVTATHTQNTTVITPEGTITEQTVKVVDLQNLVSEITEYVKLTSSSNQVSSIEMQLNPANLGKVLVEVSTQQGEVTAKIATQTETAKEAMEANVNILRENLEQQGVKVSAVEVTVQSHAFEENLQEDGSKEQEQLAKEMQKENRRINLNLNEMTLDDLQGLMSEEDMVIAKMMRDNGNVINIGA